jgi:Family of unknown function (DUF6252)
MKKRFSLIIFSMVLIACQSDVSFNEKYFQGQKDGVLWRSTSTTATVNAAGNFTLTGVVDQEKFVLTTAGVSNTTYLLGTSDLRSAANYLAADGKRFETAAIAGTPNKILMNNSGSGYTATYSASTTAVSGTGTGLKVDTTVDSFGGIATAKISVLGNGYVAGDIISINKGLATGNATFVIQNVSNSNGEITITEYANGTISGTFKLNAINLLSIGTTPDLVNFQYGKFYKIPVKIIP